MKVVLLANTSWYLANFRHDLASALREAGAEVHCIAPHSRYLDALGGEGFHVHALRMGDGSFSPLDNLRTLRHLVALYREIQPDLAHHFTPRCVVLGSMAARRVGVPAVVNALTGLGHVFTSDSVKARAVRPVLRGVFRRYLGGVPGQAWDDDLNPHRHPGKCEAFIRDLPTLRHGHCNVKTKKAGAAPGSGLSCITVYLTRKPQPPWRGFRKPRRVRPRLR